MNNLIFGFSKYSDMALDNKVQHILASLGSPQGVASFPTPAPTLASIQTALTEFTAVLALDKTPVNVQLRKVRRDALVDLLQRLAANLEVTAADDKVKLAATGFDLRKTPARISAPPDAPVNLRATHSRMSGEVILKCAKVALAKSYEVRHALDIAGPWTESAPTTNSQAMTVSGLTRGKDYYFQARAISAGGRSEWSDAVTIMVI